MPRARARVLACVIALVVSRRKQTFNAAASSGVNGGVSRVFTLPARGAFVMTLSAHRPRGTSTPAAGSRTRCLNSFRRARIDNDRRARLSRAATVAKRKLFRMKQDRAHGRCVVHKTRVAL